MLIKKFGVANGEAAGRLCQRPGGFVRLEPPFREGAGMTETNWTIRAMEFSNCNCAYGCPCQFNALPTHGNCKAVVGFQIRTGHHGKTVLDGLKVAGMFSWPGPIHMGQGEAAIIIDARADAAQREALLRILSGQDTEPGATIFNVFATTLAKVHEPVFAEIDFEIDMEKRRARMAIPGYIEARGEPILNPVTGAEHRMRIDSPNGFEFRRAEAGRGWSSTRQPIAIELADSHGHFCELNLSQSGVIP
jgi:hypothetical protein